MKTPRAAAPQQPGDGLLERSDDAGMGGSAAARGEHSGRGGPSAWPGRYGPVLRKPEGWYAWRSMTRDMPKRSNSEARHLHSPYVF